MSWRRAFWVKGMLSLCRDEDGDEGLQETLNGWRDEEETNWVSFR